MPGFTRRQSCATGRQTADSIETSSELVRPRLEGECREVTVAFADIRGFTTLAECIPLEELITVLNTYLSTIIQAFLEQGGMISKLGGDSVMAVWNAPVDCPKHALLATVAALEAQRAVHNLQMSEITLARVGFGIGINTGRVIAGGIGCEDKLEYSVIGDAVNIASRITDTAPAGKVWVAASTFDSIEGYITARPLKPMAVKGKRQPVKAYEVLDIYK
ncbi:adenylate/guanylate cyclase domain-containing protein [Chloroflexota bacterium]